MKQISTWKDFLKAAGPFLASARPIDAMEQEGITLKGDVAAAFQRTPGTVLSEKKVNDLIRKLGPVPPITLHLGRKPMGPLPVLRPGRHQLTVGADLDVMNQAIKALWHVNQIPQQLSQDDTDQLITLNDLRPLCKGIPDNATRLQGLMLPVPPTVSASGTAGNIHLEVGLRLAVEGSTDAGLICSLHVELPLDFQITDVIQFSVLAPNNAQISLNIDPSSTIVAARADSTSKLAELFKAILLRIIFFLQVSPDVAGLEIRQVDAVTVQRGGTSLVVAGANVDSQDNTSPADLVRETPPAAGNVRIAADETLVNDVLALLVSSGDLDAALNKSLPGGTPHLRSSSARAALSGGNLTLSVDTTMVAACTLGKDLGMTLTVTGPLIASGGRLTLVTPTIDLDLDDADAVVCAVSGSLALIAGLALTTAIVAYLAAANPTIEDQTLPGVPPVLLPGTELDFVVTPLHATTDNGTLFVDASASLVPDTQRNFIYLKIVQGVPVQFAAPLAGATVELLELDSPAPAGDDVPVKAIPRPGHKLTFKPSADQFLGRQVTDAGGVVRFAVMVNSIGGTETETQTTEDPRTGKLVTKVTGRADVLERMPDFGVNIKGPDGAVLAARRLIALNVAQGHVGSFDKPFIVDVPSPVAMAGSL
jgi:hypothetical protein